MDMDSAHLQGCVTVFAGPGKGSGKTAFFKAALAKAHRLGPVGFFTIGFDGTPGTEHAVMAQPGDVVATTVPLARSAGARLEILGALPGHSAIGRLCLGRVVRAGNVVPVGPGHFGHLADAIDLVRHGGLAQTILVDGAAGRVTQAGALPGAQHVYCVRADTANYLRVAENIEMVAHLANLPQDPDPGGQGTETLRIQGPLTASVLDSIPTGVSRLSLGDFSGCFLDPTSFRRAARRYEIFVRRRVPLLGFAVALKGLRREAFLAAAPTAAPMVFGNPYVCQV